jgi:excinuclease ABC subunit A
VSLPVRWLGRVFPGGHCRRRVLSLLTGRVTNLETEWATVSWFPTGLHFTDIDRLLESLNRLVDNGHSVVVIEHNLDVIKTADYVIDLGPEGGHSGGQLIACGTPEEIAACKESYTGKFLAKLLRT